MVVVVVVVVTATAPGAGGASSRAILAFSNTVSFTEMAWRLLSTHLEIEMDDLINQSNKNNSDLKRTDPGIKITGEFSTKDRIFPT